LVGAQFATLRNNELDHTYQPNSHGQQGAKNNSGCSVSVPALPARFLEPTGFVWGSLPTNDGTRLRWGHLPAQEPRAECVMVGGFGECIEKYFETIGDLAARGYSVWCLDWRGQGGSERPRRLPSRPRPRHFDRDASELASFTEKLTTARRPRLLIGHSMGGAVALLCLRRYRGLFDAAILSAPMLGIRAGGLPPALMRCITGLARVTGLGICFLPGASRWRSDRVPTPERSRVSNDPERCRLQYAWFSAHTALRVDAPTWGWLDSALRLAAQMAKKEFLAGIDTPILLFSAGVETFLCPEAHRRAARLLPDCTLVEFPDSKHEPFLERDTIRNPWFATIDRFVADRLARTCPEFRQA
jgi:lysophospholipase